MTRDELEFLISQYLDGTLPAGDRLTLEAQCAQDAEARQLLAEYRQLDVVLKGAAGSPEVQWEAFAAHVSAAVNRSAEPQTAAASSDSDTAEADVEYLVSQYLDGTLSVEQRAAFEVRLKADASAAALLADYRRVETIVKTSLPLPSVRWDALAEHLSGVVDDAGAKPIFSFKWARTAGRIAIAACLLIGTAIGIRTYRSSHHVDVAVNVGPSPTAVAIVTGPQFEQAAGKAVVEVEIGGPPTASPSGTGTETAINVDVGSNVQFADVVVSRPSRVVIAAGENSAQDNGQMPY